MEKRFRRQISASSLMGGGSLPRPPQPNASTTMDSAEITQRSQQWEEYVRCLEDDHVELRDLFEKQRVELKAAGALIGENKLKEVHIRDVEQRVKEYELFLVELMGLATEGKGLRARPQANAPLPKGNDGATMDCIRDVIQRQFHKIKYLRQSDEQNTTAIRALEKELDAAKQRPQQQQQAGDGSGEGVLIPASAKEMKASREKQQQLEKQLSASEQESRALATKLQRAQLDLKARHRADQQLRAELQELRELMAKKEELLTLAEKRSSSSAPLSAATHKKQQEEEDTSSNALGDRLVTSHHCRLFPGTQYGMILRTMPDVLKRVFIESTSAAVHVPQSFITNVSTRRMETGEDCGIAVEADIKHSYKINGDKVDVLVLDHAYAEVDALVGQAAMQAMNNMQAELQEAHQAIDAKSAEVQKLTRSLRALESSLDRRDGERENVDESVRAALDDASETIKHMYESVEQHRAEAAHANAELGKVQALLEKERTSMATKQNSLLRNETSRVKDLERQLADVEAARAAVISAALETHKEEFDITVRLTSGSMADAASKLIESRDAKALQQVLLGEASMAAGVVPMKVLRCACRHSLRSLVVKMELAYFASGTNKSSTRDSIHRKLGECPFPITLDYLQHRQEECQRVGSLEERLRSQHEAVATATAGGSAELKAIEKMLDAAIASSTELRKRAAAATSVQGKAEAVAEQVRTLDAMVRQHQDDIRQAVDKLTGRDAVIKQLRGDVSKLSAEKEGLQRRAQTMDAELAELKEKDLVSRERAKRVEAALKEKTAMIEQIKSESPSTGDVHKRVRYTTDLECREKELANKVREREVEVTDLKRRLDRAEREAEKHRLEMQQRPTEAAPHARTAAAGSSRTPVEESLRSENDALRRQIGELEVDMEDFAKIQGSLQGSLEAAQTELRAKKQDFDLLVKQVLRMEDLENRLRDEIKQLKSADGAARGSGGSAAAASSTTAHDPQVASVLRSTISVLKEAIRKAQQQRRVDGAPSLSLPPHALSARGAADDDFIAKHSVEGHTLAQQVSAVVDALLHKERPPSPCKRPSSPTIMKRSNSSKAFGRTNSAPLDAAAPREGHASSSMSASAAGTPTASSRDGGQLFTRSATSGTIRTRAVDAAPRLGVVSPMLRQDSKTYFANAAAVLAGGSKSEAVATTTTTTTTAPAATAMASRQSPSAINITREKRHASPVIGHPKRVTPTTTAAQASAAASFTRTTSSAKRKAVEQPATTTRRK